MNILISLLTMMTWGLMLPQAIADSSMTSEIKSNQSKQIMKIPMYQPPRRGAPNTRVGGGTRGFGGEVATVYVLAPDHVGLTVKEQPILNWYISKPTSMRFEFMLIDEEGIEPLLELTIDALKLKGGMQSLNLADHGVKLKAGKQYQWSVVLIPEEGHRSNDIISSGMIERRDLTSPLKAKLNVANSKEDVFIYAQEGYWYDAINELTDLIEKNPDNETLKKQHAALLNQVGLLAE